MDFLEQDCCHEIGLFLGIPLEDVLGFIKCQGKGHICCGCWKVYHQPAQALELFDLFLEAKRRYLETVQAGWNPLAVGSLVLCGVVIRRKAGPSYSYT